eukprot:15355144-Heterocapsa_arctica.AAC.1
MHPSTSTPSGDLQYMFLECLYVQVVGEGVRENVVLSQLAVGDFSMCLVDREDSQLVVPGCDLHGVREGRA